MRVRAWRCAGRQLAGTALLLIGMLLVFICLPMEALVLVLGAALAAIGLLLLR